jgi:hypothetical protein
MLFLFNAVNFQVTSCAVDKPLAYVLGIIGVFCSIINDPEEPAKSWAGFLNDMGIPRDTIYEQLSRSKTSILLLRTVPLAFSPSLLCASLNKLPVPCSLYCVKQAMNLFAVDGMPLESYDKLAECFERLLENHPHNSKASEFYREWIMEIETLTVRSTIVIKSAVEILSTLLLPVLTRCLRTLSNSNAFKEIFNVRLAATQYKVPFADWNAALQRCIGKTLSILPSSTVLKATHIKLIPRELIQGEAKQKLIHFVGDYISNGPQNKITAV